MIAAGIHPNQKRAVANAAMQALGYKLIEPADLPRPAKPVEDHEAERATRWSPQKREAFAKIEPIGIVLVATDGPVSVVLRVPGEPDKRMGHNRGIWPAKIVRTTSWRDTVTQNHDKNPFFFLGTQARIWTDSEVAARDAVKLLTGKLAAMDEEHGELQHPLRHAFHAINPEIDLELFQLEMLDAVRRMTNANVWTDDDLSAHLDLIVERSKPRAAKAGRRGA